MEALEAASIDSNIQPFATLIAERVGQVAVEAA
jgi:hypothetical protein